MSGLAGARRSNRCKLTDALRGLKMRSTDGEFEAVAGDLRGLGGGESAVVGGGGGVGGSGGCPVNGTVGVRADWDAR